MKYLIIFSIIWSQLLIQEEKSLINTLFDHISVGKLPIISKNIMIDNTDHIENDLSIKYLLFGNKDNLYYDYHYYDNDIQKNMIKKSAYDFRSFCKFEYTDFKILIYYKIGNDIRQTSIAIFSNNQMIDNLIFGYSEGGGEAEIMKYTEGEILRDFTIKTKAITWNPDYSNQKRKENPNLPMSIVTLSEYKIDSVTGKINLLYETTKYSKCSPEEFTYKNSNCQIFNYP
jgi:hypothetical protein